MALWKQHYGAVVIISDGQRANIGYEPAHYPGTIGPRASQLATTP